MNIPKVLGIAFFYKTTPVAAFEVSFSVRNEFKNTNISGEIVFALFSLFCIQIQEPLSTSIATKAIVSLEKFARFYYHKIFETRIQ